MVELTLGIDTFDDYGTVCLNFKKNLTKMISLSRQELLLKKKAEKFCFFKTV